MPYVLFCGYNLLAGFSMIGVLAVEVRCGINYLVESVDGRPAGHLFYFRDVLESVEHVLEAWLKGLLAYVILFTLIHILSESMRHHGVHYHLRQMIHYSRGHGQRICYGKPA